MATLKNKIVRNIDGTEHVIYEVSAEIFSVLTREKLFHDLFKDVDRYEERIIQAISNTQTEATRTKIALLLLNDLWSRKMDIVPYIAPNLLAKLEFDRAFHPKYRDHTVHQLKVLLLGLYLYCRNDIIHTAIIDSFKNLYNNANLLEVDYDSLFLQCWLIIAVYHDQGYVFEQRSATNREACLSSIFSAFNSYFDAPLSSYLKFAFGLTFPEIRERRARAGLRLPASFHVESLDDFLFEPDGSENILDKIEALVTPLKLGQSKNSLLNYFEMVRTEKCQENRGPYCDHGIASSIMLLRAHYQLLQYVEGFEAHQNSGNLINFIPDENIREIINLLAGDLRRSNDLINIAATAIAVHNITTCYPEIYAGGKYNLTLESFSIDLKGNPFAFLLSFCDVLQDWDRPRFSLPDTPDDPILLDQDLLISANKQTIAITFCVNCGDENTLGKVKFNTLVGALSINLNAEDIKALISENACISMPDLLSSEPIDEIKIREDREKQLKIEELLAHWETYKGLVRNNQVDGISEEEDRTIRVRHFRTFLEWCEEAKYNYLEKSDNSELNAIYELILAEQNNLNYVVPGMKIDGYEILNKIGAGGYGSVYRIKEMGSDSKIRALKVFHTSNFSEPELARRFVRGYRSMESLDHNNITRVSSYMTIPRAYLMEYIDGKNLFEFYKDKGLREHFKTASSRIKLVMNICKILGYAHRNGVRHRDIKPENIIMRWNGEKGDYEPILTDFDLAWYMQAAVITLAGEGVIGSYLYAAPELKVSRINSEAAHSPLVDVFSLGRLLYFIMTGEQPKEDVNLKMIFFDAIKHKFPEVRALSLPYQLTQIFRKATKVSPRDRFNSVAEMHFELNRSLYMIEQTNQQVEKMIFMLELALRLNTDPLYDECVLAAKNHFMTCNFSDCEIRAELVYPASGKPYLDVAFSSSVQQITNIAQKSTHKKAREVVNGWIDSWASEQSKLHIFQSRKGDSGSSFSYYFRISIPELSMDFIETLWTSLDNFKRLFNKQS